MAKTTHWAFSTVGAMFNPLAWIGDGKVPPHVETVFYAMAGALLFHLAEEFPEKFRPARLRQRVLVPVVAVLLVVVLSQFTGGQKDFFYFQF